MENDNIGFERVWIQQKVNSIAATKEWMKKASDVMDKYNFDDIYPLVVSLLRRSNTTLWDPIDVATSESREYDEPVSNINNLLSDLKFKEQQAFKDGNLDESAFLQDEIEYIEKFYNSERKTIKRVKELNYNYTDFDLFEFFVNVTDGLKSLIKNIPEDDRSLDEDELFKLYFANLFAHKINGCGIVIENNQIKILQNKISYENA